MAALIDKAKLLSTKLKVVDEKLNEIEELVASLMTINDFDLVVDFKTHANVSILEAGGLLNVKAGKAVKKLQSLASVLYVREFESAKPIPNWRTHAEAGRVVSAVRELRESIELLTIHEAKDVVEQYLIHKF
jgi:hypothetical protein